MGNIFYQDFRDFIEELNKNEVKYMLIGGYSVVFHGYSRTTGDMDIWVEKTKENYECIKKAFSSFGLSIFDMTESNFLFNSNIDVFTFGKPPVCIDILTTVKGLNFNDCFKDAKDFMDNDLIVKVISYNHLIQAKKASNRPKDIDDIQNLENK